MKPYVIEKVVLRNAVKLPAFMRIHLIVNVSKVIRYRELVREWKVEKLKPVEVNSVRATCYELKSLELDKRTTLVLSNTRELDRELFYKLVYLI